jgi:hypothetical protein
MTKFLTKTRVRTLAVVMVSALAGAGIGGAAMAYQGHMFNALHDLETAQNQLNMATPDKGGHRANAINLVGQAINEVNAGIAYAQ